MISTENIQALRESSINYIVGARLGNLSNDLITAIDKNIIREDGKSFRVKTDNGYLICSYSTARYRKNKYEMEKQIEKAKHIINNPSKNKKLKFTKTNGLQIELNRKLIYHLYFINSLIYISLSYGKGKRYFYKGDRSRAETVAQRAV